MLFRVGPTNRITRLVAALVLAAFGGVLAADAPPIGLLLVAIGVLVGIYQGTQIWRERRDPYDLSRLWETLPDEPEEDDKTRTMAYCHRCGASMQRTYSICPQCGVPLGH